MKYNAEGFLEFEEGDCDCDNYLKPRINLETANLLLREEFEKWTVVSGFIDAFSMSAWRSTHGRGTEDDNYQSRLMPPRPIRKETAEDVLRDYIKVVAAAERGERPEVSRHDLYARALRVLGVRSE